jgi:hypothetical protein
MTRLTQGYNKEEGRLIEGRQKEKAELIENDKRLNEVAVAEFNS